MNSRLVLLSLAVFLAAPLTGLSQPLPSFDLRAGQRVWVTNADGREHVGKFLAASATTIDIRIEERVVAFPLHDVARIEVRDSVRNGTRNGALAGGIGGGLFFGMLAYSMRCERDCGADYSTTADVVQSSLALGLFSAGVGALTGALIDRLIDGRRVVYGSAAARRPWQVTPIVSQNAVALRLTLRRR